MSRKQISGTHLKKMRAQTGDVLVWTGGGWKPSTVGAITFPAGLIVLWSGLLTNIPSGWALCDGMNGTPDLRDRFVRGAAAGADPGAMGGAGTHAHGAHADHIITQAAGHAGHVSAGGHTHDNHTAAAIVALGISGGPFNAPITHSNDGGHTHDAHSAHTGAAVNAHSAHDSASHLPTFFALAYIMKI